MKQKMSSLILLSVLCTHALAAETAKPALKVTSIVAKSFFPESELQSKYTSWGIDPDQKNASINLKESWFKFKKNREITVAVIDTGIDFSHPFLQQNIFTVGGKASSNNYGMDFSNRSPSTTPTDAHGHGTHVSGIIKSIFPDVKLLALKYYNPQASGQENLNATIKALEYAVDQNVDIINYSGGGPEPAVEELRILKRAEQKGIIVVAAAGNEKSDIDDKKNAYFPASYGLSNIITVGAHDENNETISSSNWGKKSVDVAAPGYRIRSAIPSSRVGYMTGTSQATAFVSGVAALLKAQFPELTANEIKTIVVASSKKEKGLAGKCVSEGRLDAGRALEVADTFLSAKFSKVRGVAQTK
jgi:subtilisin family serine protease